jgi:ATP synthase protein I
MKNDEQPPSLEQLDQSIREAKKRTSGEDGSKEASGASQAARVGVELGAGVLVGAFIGYSLDEWLGTKPLLFFLFLLIGMAAGMLNFYRALNKPDTTDEE